MISGSRGQRFIGCATDSAYVDMSSAMLASLDRNGNVADAIVVVADFSLEKNEQLLLRESAGQLGQAMRFFPVPPGSEQLVALPSSVFPIALLGRLILPRIISAPEARLLLLDSDMIVNTSLRPLIDVDLGGRIMAAVGDRFVMKHYHRPRYFNAGMMLLDVDSFNRDDLGAHAMRWLAAQPVRPDFLDQDALNVVIGDDWLDVDRRWNYFHADDPEHFTLGDYRAAHIIHFAGRKPWEDHVARDIYEFNLKEAAARAARTRDALGRPVSRDFLASCYEILLGRELEDLNIFRDRAALVSEQLVESVVASREFEGAVFGPVVRDEAFADGRFARSLSVQQRYWAADRLPILTHTARQVEQAQSWISLLRLLCSDSHLMALAGLPVLAPAFSLSTI